MVDKPIVVTVIGDPAGIGPEVIAKALATGEVHDYATPVLIGSKEVMDNAIRLTGVDLDVYKITDVDQAGCEPGRVAILDSGRLDYSKVTIAKESAACGHAVADWMIEAKELALSGKTDGYVMGPIHSESLLAADRFDSIELVEMDKSYLTLISGPLRVVHVFDHMSWREVSDVIHESHIYNAIRITDKYMTKWGMPNARIGVSGFNPHAKGEEDDRAIRPGVAKAKAEGFNVNGPIAPDSIFRHCIEDKYDVVIAMCHDQGHIAVKTWGFVGNCAIILGSDLTVTSVGHGTAFDIAGKNLASHEMILSAMKQTASLVAGRGFLPVS